MRGRRWVAYRAARGARGWDGLTLSGRRADASGSAAGAANAAVAAELPILVGGAASSLRVRAIGDSITAGFGWYSTGAPMSGWSLPWCRPSSPLNDACSSNSTTTSNSALLVYAPDYGLSNKIAWPAQWAAANGITDFANYAVTGSAPSDWRPGGAFYPQLRAATDSRPDYLVFTLGANPLLSNVLFGIDNMKCALESDLFGNFTRCVLDAFARVNLTGNLTAVYAELLGRTPATTKIIAMQYYTAVPSIALAYTSQQLERMSDLLDGVIASTVAAAGSPRLRTLAPPRFNVGIDMSPLVQPRFSCFSGGLVDGPSAQSTLTQDEFKIDPLIDAFCGGTPWIISADTGIHPEVAGHAQIASVLPTPDRPPHRRPPRASAPAAGGGVERPTDLVHLCRREAGYRPSQVFARNRVEVVERDRAIDSQPRLALESRTSVRTPRNGARHGCDSDAREHGDRLFASENSGWPTTASRVIYPADVAAGHHGGRSRVESSKRYSAHLRSSSVSGMRA